MARATEVTIAEAALELRVPRARVYDLVFRGILDGRKEGTRWIVGRVSLDAYKRRNAQAGKIERVASGAE